MIERWINDLAEVDAETGLPLCPFAKPAYEQGRVRIYHVDDNLWPSVLSAGAQLDDDTEVVVLVDKSYSGKYDDLEGVAEALNDFFTAAKMDCWALSHLSDAAVIFVQKLTELDNSAAKLEKLGYYAHYSVADYERLIAERRRRRHRHARN